MKNARGVVAKAGRMSDGSSSSRALVEDALAHIDDPAGEGARAFTQIDHEAARAAADAADRLRDHGVVPSPLAGLPMSVKDLFDVAGQVTRAGSVVLGDQPPATVDAPIVQRLRAAGVIIVGRTNMSEFAFSGIGLNPHYGTPRNPWDRAVGRIPGGSSSGAAVAVADRMSVVSIGTDTGGSVRIPAALCGLVGFKPTARRVPTAGSVPLSTSLDSIGPLAVSVTCCALVDAALAGEPITAPAPARVAGLRLGVPQAYVLDGLDAPVAAAFQAALDRLSAAGVHLVEMSLVELTEIPSINAKGGLPAAEAYAWHRALLERGGDRYDPRVRARIERGQALTAADYIEITQRRADLQARVQRATEEIDALVMPTVAMVAPTLDEVASDADFTRHNMLVLRNTTVSNFLDQCALTLPCHRPGEAPVGLMLVGRPMTDRRLLAIGRGIEPLFRPAGAYAS